MVLSLKGEDLGESFWEWESKVTHSSLNTLLMIEGRRFRSESHGAELGILFALHKEVHVLLAHFNLVGALLEAVQEWLVEVVALVLLSWLLISGLSILNRGLLHGSLLDGGLLLLRSVAWAAASHDSSDGLVSDFWTGTHSHTSGECATEATGHSTAWSGSSHCHGSSSLGGCGVVVMVNLLGWCLLDRSWWSSGASWSETGWTSAWTSWSSYKEMSIIQLLLNEWLIKISFISTYLLWAYC